MAWALALAPGSAWWCGGLLHGCLSLVSTLGSAPHSAVTADTPALPTFSGTQCPTAKIPALFWKDTEKVNSKYETAVWGN